MLYLIIGAGGTGSYLIPQIKKPDDTIVIIDGDVLEKKNLERQNFTHYDLGRYKAEVLAQKTNSQIYINQYITSVRHLMSISKLLVGLYPDTSEITLICCADNNMVRLRLELAHYLLLTIDGIEKVTYVDSGNDELSGQVFIQKHQKSDVEITDDNIKITGGLYSSIFNKIEANTFEEKLTFADFELSCDDISESAPQNIMTNQMAAFYILKALETNKNYYFNSSTATTYELPEHTLDEANNTIKDILNYENIEQEFTRQDEINLNWM